MDLLFVTPYFPPEVGAAQTRIQELAVRLVRLGHNVSVLTGFPNYPSGVVPKEWKGLFWWKGLNEGIRVYRIWSYVVPNRGFTKRILGQVSFALSASVAGGLLPSFDAIIVESPPLFDGLAGLCLSWLKRAPFLFTVSDLWPESAIQMGVLRNAFLIRLSKELERTIYRHARLVLAVTQGIHKAIISEGNDSSRIVLFRAAVDCQFFRPGIDSTAMRQALGISPNELLVLYAGTLGMAHNLSVILEVALRFQQQGSNNVRFVLAGDGAEKHMLRRKAIALDLRNLSFIDPVPKKHMPTLLNAADCVLVSLRDLPIFRGALPTKLLEAMSCSKPVIAAVGGEAEEIVRKSDSGFCVGPGDAAAICHAIHKIARDPENAMRMGQNGRECVLQEFSRDRRARELNEHLLGLGNGAH